MSEQDKWLQVATDIAREAGAYALAEWKRPRTVREKAYRDWVTDADVAVQRLIIERIREYFPTHGFLGEEEEASWNALEQGMTPVWIIDPIDGTNNYSRQLPNFVVSIGVAVAGITQVGVIYDAVHDELFRAAARKGSSLNGQRIRVSDTIQLRDAAMMFDWGHSRAKREMTFDALGRLLHEVHTFRSIGASALTLSWLAAGRIDAFFQYSLQIWDVAAAGLILIEAGGTMSGLNGDAWQLQAPHTSAIASNGKIHAKLLAKLTETECREVQGYDNIVSRQTGTAISAHKSPAVREAHS